MAIKGFQQYLQRGRVPLGFLLGAISLFWAAPRPISIIVGAVIALFGVLFRAWSAGHVRKNERLATSGPYAYTRNPLYFGSFFLGLGFTIATARIELAIIFIIFYLSVYWAVMRAEAEYMTQLFPQEYQTYAAAVPMFWPRLTRWEGSTPLKFDWQLYLKYREYRAFLGMILAIALLVAKIYWPPT